MTDRPRLALSLFLLALAALLGGCNTQGAGPVGSDARFFADSRHTGGPWLTLPELEAKLTHPLIYPQYRPEDAQVRWARLEDTRTPARVTLSFVSYSQGLLGSRQKFWFYLEEWRSDGVIELAEGDPVDIGGTEGRLRVATPQKNGDAGSIEVAWEACGVEFLLRSWPQAMEQSEAIRVAASTLEACP